MSSSLQNLLILAGIVLLVVLGYYVFVQNGQGSTHNQMVNNQATIEADKFLQRLHEIEGMSFTGRIFTDPRFTNLVDNTPQVVPEPFGKTDPFAPVN